MVKTFHNELVQKKWNEPFDGLTPAPCQPLFTIKHLENVIMSF